MPDNACMGDQAGVGASSRGQVLGGRLQVVPIGGGACGGLTSGKGQGSAHLIPMRPYHLPPCYLHQCSSGGDEFKMTIQ